MIIRDKDQDVLEVEMFHIAYIGKQNANLNFRRYLEDLAKQFDQELTRHLFSVHLPGYNPVRNDGSSHIILPDDHKT